MFVALPASVFALSTAGPVVFFSVLLPLVLFVVIVLLINLVQRKRPSLLPFALRNWSFLPEWARSLDPLDRLIANCLAKCCCCPKECCPQEATRRRDPTLGLSIPSNTSQVNILQPCSTSSSVLTLDSACGTEYHTMNGFENVAFGQLPQTPKRRKSGDNNNTIQKDWDFGNTTAL